ncbi:hypothetical protein CALVIDRAFT_329151 [Calocera viscosa TUFC12733]|uniref:F-box domain-containing protein n=1 Tax=Calocera viscosa (strain TUFC12733) TaxID=1330018 RepID=A0A167HUD1_CALVF|nr:hypothetical protein CALVIDRAFT_329151 [Calocera viscosa TUFC12733]
MKYFPLFSLPSELVIAVLQQLDIPDLLVCKQVCRPLNSLISTTLSFQYSTALYLSGLAECAPSPLPTTERLALLRRHFLAWKHLQPSLRCSIPLSSHNSTLYELYGGVFARGTALPSRSAWGEDTRPRRKTNGMYVVDLPSEVSGLGASSWERQDVGFVVADFTLDRAQDLWVGVERSYATGRAPFLIHLRLLSTNAPHPLARSASLVHTLSYPLPHAHDQQDVVTHYTMQVCGGMLGVLFQHHPVEDVGGVKREELIVWDWKRGVRVAEITPEEAQEEEAHSFSFLAEDLLLLAKTTFDEGLLDIVQLPPSSAIPIPSPSPPGPGATPRERRHCIPHRHFPPSEAPQGMDVHLHRLPLRPRAHTRAICVHPCSPSPRLGPAPSPPAKTAPVFVSTQQSRARRVPPPARARPRQGTPLPATARSAPVRIHPPPALPPCQPGLLPPPLRPPRHPPPPRAGVQSSASRPKRPARYRRFPWGWAPAPPSPAGVYDHPVVCVGEAYAAHPGEGPGVALVLRRWMALCQL